jgi:ACS family glucarate transporter-like MFS transporter
MNGSPHPPELGGPALEGARATGVRWQIVGLLMAYSFMSWFNRVSMSVAGTERIMGQYGIDPTDMGLVYSALLLAYAVCMTPGGWLIDARGPWAALLLMGLGSGLFVILTGVVGWVFATAGAVWLALVVVRALMGVCTAPIYPAASRMVAHWLPLPARAGANGFINGAAPVGIACTFFGFGTLMDRFGWPAAFVITGAVTVALALVWWAWARDYPEEHPGVNPAELRLITGAAATPTDPALGRWEKEPWGAAGRGWFQAFRDSLQVLRRPFRPAPVPTELPPPAPPVAAPASPWWELLANRSLVLLTVSYGAIGYFEYLFFFWTQYYFETVLHLGVETGRLYATVLNLATAVGMVGGGWLSDRLMRSWGYRRGRAAVPVGGMLASAVLLFVGLGAGELWAVVLCFALALAAVGACEGPCWATAVELGGRRGGTAAGIFNTGGNVGGLLAPVLTPWVSGIWGWSAGITLGALACLVGVVLWLGIDPSERLPEPGEKKPVPAELD